MRSSCALLLILLLFVSVSAVQNMSAQGSARTDVYHVHFAKAMGLDDAAKSAGSVYVVSVYRAAPGHREQLEKSLAQPPGRADTVAGNVLLQHLEGGPWNFLTVARYNSWQDFANNEKASVADTLKPDGGWLAIRNHSTYHNDTITDRIAP